MDVVDKPSANDPSAVNMARRIAEHDWTNTPLGPMDQWPQSLKTAVSICLGSRFPMMVWWGPDLINLYNDAYIPVLGKWHPDALGKSGREIWAEIWDVIAPQVEEVMERGGSTFNERVHLVYTRHGYPEDTWYTWSYGPIRDETGRVGGLFNTCHDESGRVLAEQERDRLADQRRTAEQRERTILKSITDAFFATDREFNFTHANPQSEKLLGRKPGELIGLNLYKEYASIVGTAFDTLYQQAVREGKSGSATIYYPDHDRWYEAHAYPSDDGMSVFFRDVSDEKRRENALRISEERFRLIMASVKDHAIFTLDLDGKVTTWNVGAEQMFGYTEAEILGQSAAIVFTAEDRIANRPAIELQVSASERLAEDTRFHVRKDGSKFFTSGSMERLLDETGHLHGFVKIIRDITEYKRAETERERLLESERIARNEAERAGRMKDEFLATLSHELRTPLNAILGWSQIMQKAKGASDIEHGLAVIERNARAQAQIIEDLLDMSRIISGKVRLDVQRLDLSAIVQNAVETTRPAAEAKGVRLQSVIDPLHGVVVNGDPNRIQQVLWNLLTNAIKFTPREGQVRVLLERVNSHLEISVIDTGEGIRPEFLPYVFDRFRQADASTTRRHGGLGLGLSIVKQLIELHGGSVQVQSQGTGKGATFSIVLPLLAIHPESENDTERRHPRSLPLPSALVDSCNQIVGVRVLVIDDEPDARALVKRLLEDCGAIATVAESASEALGMIETGGFDVLVSDIGMPDEDGYSLIKRVRRLGKKKGGDIPAVALTAYARAEDRVKAVSAGFMMHIAKPVEPAELITMVAAAAGRTGIADD